MPSSRKGKVAPPCDATIVILTSKCHSINTNTNGVDLHGGRCGADRFVFPINWGELILGKCIGQTLVEFIGKQCVLIGKHLVDRSDWDWLKSTRSFVSQLQACRHLVEVATFRRCANDLFEATGRPDTNGIPKVFKNVGCSILAVPFKNKPVGHNLKSDLPELQ